MRIIGHIVVAVLFAVPVVAQNGACVVGPGALFGVVGYQCANCGFKQELGARASYTFFAEPVVTQTRAGSMVANGDVIVAVDDSPITTQTGADRFAYPTAGPHTLTVRRGRQLQEIRVDLTTSCSVTSQGSFGSNLPSVSTSNVVGGGSGFNAIRSPSECDSTGVVRLHGDAVPVNGTRSDPLIYIDGVRQPSARDSATSGRFGFAIDSRPVCRSEKSDGRTKYSVAFEDYPKIVAVRPGSAADKAGLREGDAIVNVEGKSVLETAVWFTGAYYAYPLHMTVRRDGKVISVVMVATP